MHRAVHVGVENLFHLGGRLLQRGPGGRGHGGVHDPVDGTDHRQHAEDGFGVRTGFHAVLTPSAARWTRGANEGPPPGFLLTPGGLRLWAIAAGRRDEVGYLLGTAEPDDAVHLAGGAQLSRLGVAAVSIAQRGGPGWRVTSLKRLRRLTELLGEPPAGGEQDWPIPG